MSQFPYFDEKKFSILQELVKLINPQHMLEYARPPSYQLEFFENSYTCKVIYYTKTARIKLRCEHFPTFMKVKEQLEAFTAKHQLRLDAKN